MAVASFSLIKRAIIVVCCSNLIDIGAQSMAADVLEETEAQYKAKEYS